MKPRWDTGPYCPPRAGGTSGPNILPDRLAPRTATGLESAPVADRALVRLSLAEAGDLIRRRALSPVELLDAVLARIAALNPRLNPFTTVPPPAEPRAAPPRAERETPRGA